jgi:uncharacterized protein with HEPN domain
MWRDDGYLLDILEAARRILLFIDNVTEDRFLSDELIQSAVIRQFEIIGEAAGRISTEYIVNHPTIPWREMVSTRNRLIHEYEKVRMDVIWEATQTDIPSLIERILPLIPIDSDA